VSADYTSLPDDLPVPVDDGAADGLVGRSLPDLALPSTAAAGAPPSVIGGPVPSATAPGTAPPAPAGGPAAPSATPGEYRLGDAPALLVVYVYPMTGTPGVPLPHGWDDIPGARGCTPQACSYRDALAGFDRLGAAIVGISAQTAAEQAEFAAREHIPFPLLSDPDLRLATALALPTFEVEGRTLYRRLTLVAEKARIVKTFYPVFPPDRDAATVFAWLAAR
jgi:peroxiredoxin